MKILLLSVYLFFIIIGLSFNYFKFTRNKLFNIFFSFIVIAFISFLVYYNTDCPDYTLYYREYMRIKFGVTTFENTSTGKIFYKICKFFISHNIEFREFKTICIAFFLIILNILIFKLINCGTYIWCMYMILGLLMDIVQFRTAFALTFVIIGLVFILSKYKLLHFMSIPFFIIAGFIHETMFFFALILFIPILEKIKNSDKIIMIFSFVLIPLSSIIIKFAEKYVLSLRFERYFINGYKTGIIGFSATTLYLIINYIIVYSCKKNYKIPMESSDILYLFTKRKKFDRNIIFYNIAYYIQVYNFITIPLLFFARDFNRIHRLSYLLCYLSIQLYRENSDQKYFPITIYKYKFNIPYFVFTIYYVILSFYITYLANPKVFTSILL